MQNYAQIDNIYYSLIMLHNMFIKTQQSFCNILLVFTSLWTRVNLNPNRTGHFHRPMYRPDPILCRLGFNFDSVARLCTVPGLFNLSQLSLL